MKDEARQKAETIAATAMERKAIDPVLIRVGHLTSIAEYFLICSGKSNRQVQSLAEHIRDESKKRGGYRTLSVEGLTQGHWVLLDFGDVVAHVFYHPTREFYDLEGLWIEGEHIDLERL